VRETLRRQADAVVVHEPAFADAVPGATVVPHGVEPAAPVDRTAARAALRLDDDRLTVLCFGFLAPYKGLEVAIAAAAEAGDAVELVVAGGAHPRVGESYVRELEAMGAHVRFTGHVPDLEVGPWFAAADLALFPYPQPVSSSGAFALALAHRTPVLLSPELAACAGAPAALTAPREAGALGRALRALAADRTLLGELGATAAAMAADRSWAAVADRHLELYAEVGRV
jgi:glycosyltransferase involved in cell wall biosynthesis